MKWNIHIYHRLSINRYIKHVIFTLHGLHTYMHVFMLVCNCFVIWLNYPRSSNLHHPGQSMPSLRAGLARQPACAEALPLPIWLTYLENPPVFASNWQKGVSRNAWGFWSFAVLHRARAWWLLAWCWPIQCHQIFEGQQKPSRPKTLAGATLNENHAAFFSQFLA